MMENNKYSLSRRLWLCLVAFVADATLLAVKRIPFPPPEQSRGKTQTHCALSESNNTSYFSAMERRCFGEA